MPVARLTDRAVLAVTGPEAAPFLQGLVTNDVTKVSPGSSAYAALLTPQGKIITDFIVHAAPDGLHLDVPATHAADLLKRLKLYRLRAKIGLDDISQAYAVYAFFPPMSSPGEVAAKPAEGPPPDPRLPALGGRWVAPADSVTPDAALADWHRHRLALGVPDSADTEGQFALDANLEELHGLDFKKGCYVGQEVTARMKHKAAPRRRLVPVAFEGDLPPPGTRLTDAAGAEIGELKAGWDRIAVLSVRLAALTPLAQSQPVLADGAPARIKRPAYPLPPLATALPPTEN